jgi:hypothetical protein
MEQRLPNALKFGPEQSRLHNELSALSVLAVAGRIEPPNGGIKIRLII